MLSSIANVMAEEFMYVYRCKVRVDDSLCYLVKLGCDDSGITIKCDCDKFRKEYEKKKRC